MVARKLEAKLRDHLISGGNNAGLRVGGSLQRPTNVLFESTLGVNGLERPGEFNIYRNHYSIACLSLDLFIVLIIVDRDIDLASMLSHSWTYQALVHDVLDMKLNRVTLSVCYHSRWRYCTHFILRQTTPLHLKKPMTWI